MAKTVLVVDDNPVIRKAVSNLFMSEADFDVCGQAQNGREAIERAQELRPDLIIMDLSMPVMNGFEAARFIKAKMPDVRIVMFSEYSAAIEQREAQSAGIASLVSKSQHASTLIDEARSLWTENAA